MIQTVIYLIARLKRKRFNKSQ